jgi:hypothetical protein
MLVRNVKTPGPARSTTMYPFAISLAIVARSASAMSFASSGFILFIFESGAIAIEGWSTRPAS